MLSNPRRRGVTRLAACSVLAATALASGALAALGTTAAHANAYSGEYDRLGGVRWAAAGAAPTQAISISDLPDADQPIARVRLTLFGVTVGHVSGLHVTLNTPNGSE